MSVDYGRQNETCNILLLGGWKKNQTMTNCYADGQTVVFMHAHFDEMWVKVNPKRWEIIAGCCYRHHGALSKLRGHGRLHGVICWGTSPRALLEKLQPKIVVDAPRKVSCSGTRS
jgi:hypothetical protein